jgi:hypothetical protein
MQSAWRGFGSASRGNIVEAALRELPLAVPHDLTCLQCGHLAGATSVKSPATYIAYISYYTYSIPSLVSMHWKHKIHFPFKLMENWISSILLIHNITYWNIGNMLWSKSPRAVGIQLTTLISYVQLEKIKLAVCVHSCGPREYTPWMS